jgi:ADP-heptose:LPS heptosyltransferase/tetratricopeptide (TPR) repeat protein
LLDRISQLWNIGKIGELVGSGASSLISRANAARDRKSYRDAAALYEQALGLIPDNAAIRIQCGHMFKEAGVLAKAEEHYKRAQELTPDDPDLALQMGHFYKVSGRLRESETAYMRTLELEPDWSEPAAELEALYRKGFRSQSAAPGMLRSQPTVSVGQPSGAVSPNFDEHVAMFGLLRSLEGLAPEVSPRHPRDLYHNHRESIELRHCGRSERTRWGMINTLRGVEALRGFCISAVPIVELQVTVDGQIIHRGSTLEGVPLKYERDNIRLCKYAFNVWYDFGTFVQGRYDVELRFTDAYQATRVHREHVAIAAPLSPELHPESDGLVSVSDADPRSLEEQINSHPSMIRPAQRSIFAKPPRNVLIMRLDQLGDMVCSVPALRRLRELLPNSRLVGMIAPANQELEATLKLFDEVILVDFPDDELERRRVMPLTKQYELRKKLEPYKFDLAIDMSDSGVSRPLLFLSGAPFLYGFRYFEFPWLSAAFEGGTHDFANGLERVPHTNKLMGLIEWLGILMKSHSTVVPRTDLPRSVLGKYGIAETDEYVVFHTGARLAFSRWPYYDKLSAMVLQRTNLKVVMMTDDPAMRAGLPAELTGSTRFQLLDQRLSFDDFDALLSFCSAFVGNDSGPKHLAALRGANVVSIHLARNNWNEWGQENNGYIVSRRVPCAGCSIHHDPEECGKGFPCITNISADEVYGAISGFFDADDTT